MGDPTPRQRLGGRLGWWLAVLLLAAGRLVAHDFWIEPSEFAPRPGEAVGLGVWVGEHLAGEPVPRRAAGIARFSILTPAGELPLQGVEGVHPAGLFTPAVEGPHWVVYESRPRRLTLAADRFESYLAEEGLERIVALRRERSQADLPGRESYRRCAKSLLLVGGDLTRSAVESVAGCPVELLLATAPSLAAAGGEVAVRLLVDGRPLAGAPVRALRRAAPQRVLEAITDSDGRAVFAPAEAGVWLFKTVHMEPAAPQTEGVDWQSWWASLSLRLPAASGAAAPR